ncbi:hypothetical protein TWF694_003677 [Orbilia ellipsospora]|uniref:Uncharacterized protein n=1 Tax=Orbilia ellipsospora TaxID=2528407 RepID=A0AAV9X089_9PEZI
MYHLPSTATVNRPDYFLQDPQEGSYPGSFMKISHRRKRGKKWLLTLTGNRYHTPQQEVPTVPPHSMGYIDPFYATLGSLDHPGIDVTLAAYKHAIVGQNETTPKPWRFELTRIFQSIPTLELQKGYIECYTLGYNGQNFWYGQVPRSFEQAFMFGQLERQWDEDVQGVLFRRLNGISEEGEVDGVRKFLRPGEIEDPDIPELSPGGHFVPRHRMPVWERVRGQHN